MVYMKVSATSGSMRNDPRFQALLPDELSLRMELKFRQKIRGLEDLADIQV